MERLEKPDLQQSVLALWHVSEVGCSEERSGQESNQTQRCLFSDHFRLRASPGLGSCGGLCGIITPGKGGPGSGCAYGGLIAMGGILGLKGKPVRPAALREWSEAPV